MSSRPGDLELQLPERYRVLRPIGRGGMGVVVLADDQKLGRAVAVKVARAGLHADVSDEKRKRRFLAEVRATAQLEHPSIVPVYDATETADGRMAFTMRYVEGRSLGQAIAHLRAQPIEEARRATQEHVLDFLKICDAVAYAHSRGVLHRDLKPANVMLGSFGEVFVMDWGLAGAAEAERPVKLEPEPRDTAITEPGTIVGSPGYVAPELVRGRAATPQTDLWSLGAILYEVLTLERAICGELAPAILANTVVHAIVAPRERAPERGIGEAMEAVVMRALEPSPEARYASVAELRAAVAAAI